MGIKEQLGASRVIETMLDASPLDEGEKVYVLTLCASKHAAKIENEYRCVRKTEEEINAYEAEKILVMIDETSKRLGPDSELAKALADIEKRHGDEV